MNLLNVGRFTCQASLNVEVRLERNPLHIEKRLARWQILLRRKKFILRETSECNKTSLSTRKFIVGEKALNVLSMIKVFS